MKYPIFLLIWLLLSNQDALAQGIDQYQGQPIEMKGRKFRKGASDPIKFGFSSKRLGPYLEGEQAQTTYAEAQKVMRKANVTTVATTTLLTATIPFTATGIPGFLMLRISSAVGMLPMYYYGKSGLLIQQAIAEHNAYVGNDASTVSNNYR
jgi:hypothetical protein